MIKLVMKEPVYSFKPATKRLLLVFSILKNACLFISQMCILITQFISLCLLYTFKKEERIYNTNEFASSPYNLGFIQDYITDTFTKPERIAKKFPSTTIYQVSVKSLFMLTRALVVPKYAYAKDCFVTIKKKIT